MLLPQNKPSLNRTQIKYIDHTAMFFLSHALATAPAWRIAAYSAMRVIGRLTAPIMLFFLVEGFLHTSSRKKYAARLFVFGLVSQVPYALACHNTLLVADCNIIITLFVTFLMLCAAENIRSRVPRCIAVLLLMLVTFCCDWGIIGPLMALLFYRFRGNRNTQLKAYAAVCAVQVASAALFLAHRGLHWYGELWQAGMFLVIPVLLCYDGTPGNKSAASKWMFYAVYPLHLFVLWGIQQWQTVLR